MKTPEIDWGRLEAKLHKQLCRDPNSGLVQRRHRRGSDPVCTRAVRMLRETFDRELHPPTS